MNVMKKCGRIEIYTKMQDTNRILGCSLKMVSIKREKKMDRLEIKMSFIDMHYYYE